MAGARGWGGEGEQLKVGLTHCMMLPAARGPLQRSSVPEPCSGPPSPGEKRREGGGGEGEGLVGV